MAAVVLILQIVQLANLCFIYYSIKILIHMDAFLIALFIILKIQIQ